MRQLLAILTFYKPFVFWSLAINTAMAMVNPLIFPTVITKLFLIIFIWYLHKETNAKRKLIFYKNLGISNFKLFSIMYFIDILITITFILIFKEYIYIEESTKWY